MNSAQTEHREARLSAVAGLVIEAMTDAEIAAALGVHRHTVERDVETLRKRYEARNRVALALALDRMRLAETFAAEKVPPQ